MSKDGETRNRRSFYKNMEDVLTGGVDLKKMGKRHRRLFEICQKKSIKMNPSKFKLGER